LELRRRRGEKEGDKILADEDSGSLMAACWICFVAQDVDCTLWSNRLAWRGRRTAPASYGHSAEFARTSLYMLYTLLDLKFAIIASRRMIVRQLPMKRIHDFRSYQSRLQSASMHVIFHVIFLSVI
jgi:hypothetical protein